MDTRYLEQLSYGEDPDPNAGLRAFFPYNEPEAEPAKPSERLDPQQAAKQALALLDQNGMLNKAPIALGPRPGPELEAALAQLGQPAPTIRVHCKGIERCGGRSLGRWIYDHNWKAITLDHPQTKDWTRGAPPWLDRANAGKGPVQTAGGRAGTHDGNGTQNYRCKRCGRNVPVSAKRRFQLYLEAIAKGRKETWI